MTHEPRVHGTLERISRFEDPGAARASRTRRSWMYSWLSKIHRARWRYRLRELLMPRTAFFAIFLNQRGRYGRARMTAFSARILAPIRLGVRARIRSEPADAPNPCSG